MLWFLVYVGDMKLKEISTDLLERTGITMNCKKLTWKQSVTKSDEEGNSNLKVSSPHLRQRLAGFSRAGVSKAVLTETGTKKTRQYGTASSQSFERTKCKAFAQRRET